MGKTSFGDKTAGAGEYGRSRFGENPEHGLEKLIFRSRPAHGRAKRALSRRR
jgi:hypothetical protein